MAARIKKGDTVIVLTGRDKGRHNTVSSRPAARMAFIISPPRFVLKVRFGVAVFTPLAKIVSTINMRIGRHRYHSDFNLPPSRLSETPVM